MNRRQAALALALVLLSGCDTFVAPTPRAAGIELALETDGGDRFDFLRGRLNRLFVTLHGSAGSRETVIEIDPEGNRIRARLMLDARELVGDLGIDVEVRSTSDDLFFRGSTVLSTQTGGARSAAIEVVPVARELDIETGHRLSFDAFGDTLRLPDGVVLFGNGDAIPGAKVSWLSRDPRVVEVIHARTIVARGNGETELIASYGDVSRAFETRVNQVPSGLSAILPADTTVGIAELVRLRVDARDRNGFPLAQGFAAEWTVEPAYGVFDLFGQSGVGITRCLGSVTVSVAGISARARVNVAAPQDPGMELVWTTGDALSAGDLAGHARAGAVQGLGQHPTRRPGTGQIAYVREGLLYAADLFSGQPSRQLVTAPGLVASWPEYSTDGSWIYFGAQNPSASLSRIYRIRPDGSGFQALTPANVWSDMPTTSPDGTQLSYVREGNLVVQDINGQPRTIVTGGVLHSPRWSPTGQWIAFIDSSGTWSLSPDLASGLLYVVRPDGSGRRMVDNAFFHPGITWSPDGTRILGADWGAIRVEHLAPALRGDLCWHPLGEVGYSTDDPPNTFGHAWWR